MTTLMSKMRSGLPEEARRSANPPARTSLPAHAPPVRTLPAGFVLPPAAVCGAMRVVAGPESPPTPPAGPQAAGEAVESPIRVATDSPAVATAPQASKASPAAESPCGCPIFWLDAYGNLHCGECRPPRSAAMVRRKLIVGSSGCAAGDSGGTACAMEWRDFDTDEKIISDGSKAKTDLSEPEKIISHGSLKSLDSLNFPVVYRGTCPGGGAFAAWCEKISPDDKLKSSDAKKIISSGVAAGGAGRASASAATPTIPAGARIFYLMHDGKQVEAGSSKAGASKGRGGRGKSTSSAGSPGSSSTATIDRSKAKWFTWEGADRWWPVVAVSGAEVAVLGEDRAATA